MSVVLRCPSCGTTRATSGECEACHEAQVRYFCTEHTPGLWLDASACPKCGARFGESARGPSAPPVPAIPIRKRSPAPSRAPAATPPRPPPYSRTTPPDELAGGWGSRRRSYPADEEEREPSASPTLPWQKILEAAFRSRYLLPTARRHRERLPVGRAVGGCLTRLLLGAVLVFIALAGAVFLFGRALLGG